MKKKSKIFNKFEKLMKKNKKNDFYKIRLIFYDTLYSLLCGCGVFLCL